MNGTRFFYPIETDSGRPHEYADQYQGKRKYGVRPDNSLWGNEVRWVHYTWTRPIIGKAELAPLFTAREMQSMGIEVQ